MGKKTEFLTPSAHSDFATITSNEHESKLKNFSFFILATVMSLSACGGGGGGGGGSGTLGSAVNFTFVPPAQGQTLTYAYTVIDTAKDKVNYGFTVAVAQKNSDGTYNATWTPTTGGYKLGSTNYYLDVERDVYDNKGQLIQYTDVSNGLVLQTCAHAHANGGRPASVMQGQSWVDAVAVTCNNTSNNFSYTGNFTYLGLESVTVPAGTFNAYKIQDVEVDPNGQAAGATTTSTITSWFDTSTTGSRLLKSTVVYTYSGITPTADSETSWEMELASYQ